MGRIQITRRTNISSVLLLIMILVHSCTSIRLISDYDEITDKTLTEVQENVSNYFFKLENTVGTRESNYENYSKLFEQIKIDLNTIEVRAKAIEKNRIVVEQIKGLQNMISELEKVHKSFGDEGFSSYDLIKPNLNSFNSAFVAIFKLQMALKRGEKIE